MVVRLLHVRLQQLLPLVLHLLQPEFLFQLPAGFHRAVPLVGVVYLFPFLVHTGRNDMDMFPVYILVYIYNVGLVAVAHSLHILFCQFRELGISEAVIYRRVQGNMQDGLFRVLVGEEVVVKRPKGLLHDTIRIACHIGNHTVSRNDTRGGVIHFLLVVGDCSVERDTPVDFRHHVIPPPFSSLSDRHLQIHG